MISERSKKEYIAEKLKYIAIQRSLPKVSDDFGVWVPTVFPHLNFSGLADRHIELWKWASSIERGERPKPFVAIWPRGSGKSTTAELIVTFLGALKKRAYVWYVSGTQALADLHIESIGALIESETFGKYYPKMAQRKIGKFGNIRGWRRNRLRCANGFTIDALGLDIGARGSKIEEQRPDLIIFDDIDDVTDSDQITLKKILTITASIMPAGSKDVAVLAVQNLILNNGFFGRMANGTAEYLSDRILSGPHKAINDLEIEQKNGKFLIKSGKPTWIGQDLKTCQDQINSWGYTGFLREAQHEIRETGSLFDHIDFMHIDIESVPELMRTNVWIDPAVTSTDNSDKHGVSVAGVDEAGNIYIFYSFEKRVTPEQSIRIGIEKALEYGSGTVGVETDQGGDTWQSVYNQVIDRMNIPEHRKPAFVFRKAGSYGSKVERAQRLLVLYETGKIYHVYGTHKELEDALKRFPISKPYDLVDATTWCVIDFTESPSWALS